MSDSITNPQVGDRTLDPVVQFSNLPKKTKEWMDFFGNMGPTYQGETVKGWIDGDKFYLDAEDLREAAAAFLEVAAILRDRKLNVKAED